MTKYRLTNHAFCTRVIEDMRLSAIATITFPLLFTVAGASVSLSAPEKAPISIIKPYLSDEADAQGDTMLIRLCRHVSTLSPQAQQMLRPLIVQLIDAGADPLHENHVGCNAMFYINGMPELMKAMSQECRLPRELTLRFPHDEGALLRFLRLRAAQMEYATLPGSRDYLIRRYCKPAYPRAEALLKDYMSRSSLNRMPIGAIGDCLDLMRLAEQEATYAYVDNLIYWDHGEHFLEELPATLLRELHRLNWPVSPGKLRAALEKLDSLLPTNKEDMIDCYAAGPMSLLLDLLIHQEGKRAMADLKRYAQSFDPDLVQTCLRLQLRLEGLTPPDETNELPDNSSDEIKQIRAALLTDMALKTGRHEVLTSEIITQALECCRRHHLTQRATMLDDFSSSSEENAPVEPPSQLTTDWQELRDEPLSVILLRYLLDNPSLLSTTQQP